MDREEPSVAARGSSGIRAVCSAKRQDAVSKGKSPSGPAGYQEVGCATVSYYDRVGERLVTRRMARMPEANKATLKSQLTAEVMGALIEEYGQFGSGVGTRPLRIAARRG